MDRELLARVGRGVWLCAGLILGLLAVQASALTSGAVTAAADHAAAPPAPGNEATAEALRATDVLGGSSGAELCGYPDNCSNPSPPVRPQPPTPPTPDPLPDSIACGLAGIYNPPQTVDTIELSHLSPCDAAVERQLSSCTLSVTTIGWGSQSINLPSSTLGTRFTSSASAAEIVAQNGTLYSQYDCAGSTVTVTRSVFND